MSSIQPYSLAEMRQFLTTEHPGLHGTSPYVHKQNESLAKSVGRSVACLEPTVLGVQFIGSRAHGWAAPDSDMDLAIMTFGSGGEARSILQSDLREALSPEGIHVDGRLAAAKRGIGTFVPLNPGYFIEWVIDSPASTIGLYERGVHDTPALRLAALAATEVILAQNRPAELWTGVQEAYSMAYLGTPMRLLQKLPERLPDDLSAIEATFDDAFWEERRANLGLRGIHEFRSSLEDLPYDTEDVLLAERARSLYHGVVIELSR